MQPSTICTGIYSPTLQLLPLQINVSLEIAYPSRITQNQLSIRQRLDLNEVVDSVLRNIYHTSASLEAPYARRKIIFASFSPDVCSAVNWKQPNCERPSSVADRSSDYFRFVDPVFLVSRCGKSSTYTPSPTALGSEEENDPRLSSIGAAVEFARINNLLGVFADADLLVSLCHLRLAIL